MAHRIRIGDCFAISLDRGRFAYCQFLCLNAEMGGLIKVFDLISNGAEVSVTDLKDRDVLFPPVFVGLRHSVREGRWRFIGRLPTEQFELPTFRDTFGEAPGVHEDWSLWDGKTHRRIGRLPVEFRGLEMKVVWSDELLEARIISGHHIFEEYL